MRKMYGGVLTMKILMLGTTFPRYKGSRVGTFVFELAKSLVKQGGGVDVLTTNIPGGKTTDVMSGVNVHRFTYFFSANWHKLTYPGSLLDQVRSSILAVFQIPFFLASYIVQCIKVINKYDTVICNWIYTGTIMQVARFITRSKCSCIVVIHGSDMKFLENGGFIGKIFLRTLKNADAVCVVAKHFMTILEEYNIEHRHLMPNGVNYDDFSIDIDEAKEKLALTEIPVVLYVGRLTEAKGVDTLVSAMRGIDNAELIIIGDGKTRSNLEKQAEIENVNVRFMGAVAPVDIPLWMSAATIFVLPSLSEGRPTVINEAMASRTVCIASDIAGTRELVGDNKTGFLVKTGDAEAFRNRIELLLNDRILRQKMESNAYTYLRENVPTWSEAATNYIKLIKNIENNREDG